jgi:hypothetical protein
MEKDTFYGGINLGAFLAILATWRLNFAVPAKA